MTGTSENEPIIDQPQRVWKKGGSSSEGESCSVLKDLWEEAHRPILLCTDLIWLRGGENRTRSKGGRLGSHVMQDTGFSMGIYHQKKASRVGSCAVVYALAPIFKGGFESLRSMMGKALEK